MLLIRRLLIQTRQLQCASVSIHHAMRAASSSAAAHHPRIAVIGSGPSGLYVCARLLQKLPNCRIDVFDKAQAPFGLIYYGVAPDHLDMKKSMNSFERMFTENRERLELFCNVDINRDVTYQELCATYEAVVLAYGASKARGLGMPNEQAPNCFSGLAFVSWYNGVPQFTPGPQLDQEEAVVVGNGNVAIDCSRILLSSPQRLAQTDITEQALRALKKSRVRNIRVLGRRGPKEISFTIKELRELLGLEGVDSYCAIEGPQAEQLRQDMAKMERPRRRLMELMLAYASVERAEKQKIGFPDQKRLQLQFHRQPVAIGVDSSSRGGRVSSLRVRHALTGEEEEIPCGLLIYAIGFENVLLAGLPRTEEGRLKMLDWCRVPDDQAAVYATGWCSHAARGLIADSQQQAYTVADQIAEDWVQRRIAAKPTAAGDGNSREQILKKLQEKGVNYVSWDDWRHIDECERRMGALLGKTREKLTDVTTMLRIMRHGA